MYWRHFLGPSFGPIFFLIYSNKLPINIESTITLFTDNTPDDTSLFSIAHRAKISVYELNKYLHKISE